MLDKLTFADFAPLLPQRIYSLAHASLGRLEIFPVLVGRDADGVHCQPIFA